MLYILLPAYNEEQALPDLLADIENTCNHLPHCIVAVDDGSTDSTLQVLRDFAVRCPNLDIVEHGQNKGLSRALKSGFARILTDRSVNFSGTGQEDELQEIVVTMDADNTHPADRIPLLCAGISAGSDLVVASRYAEGAEQIGLNFGRKLLSWGAGKVMQFFFPIEGIKDYSSGYRAYRLSILQRGFNEYGEKLIENSSFAGMAELLLKLAPLCKQLSEVPLQLHYERKEGASKMKIWTTIWGYGQIIYHLKHKPVEKMEWAEE
ncbi:MAG TPA: glycosyltransferase [Desulfitobacteriaceae bacterium]|nr:glycosyltransferase [Desulfitobacteriaceae bacterium]